MTPPGPRSLSADATAFRRRIIDALWDERRFGYIDENRFVGTCSVCGDIVVVRFAGYAPRAHLNCWGGCYEDELAEKLSLAVRHER